MNKKRLPQSRLEDDPCTPLVAKIIDFDSVQDWEPCSPKTKDVLGTNGYIAPEAYAGDYSPASDIYAAGVIMFKLLTRKMPSKLALFDDQPGENYVGSPAMKRIRKRLEMHKIDFDVPPLDKCPEAKELVQAMLAYDMERRPSAQECLQHSWFQTVGNPLVMNLQENRVRGGSLLSDAYGG